MELATSKASPSNIEGDGPEGRPNTPTATIEALIEKQRVLLVKLQSTETTFERTVELRNTLPHLLPVGHLREILLVLHIDDNVMLTRKRKLSKAERALGKSHRSNNEGDGPSTHWNTYGPSTDEIRSPHLDEPYKMLLDKYSEDDITNIQHGEDYQILQSEVNMVDLMPLDTPWEYEASPLTARPPPPGVEAKQASAINRHGISGMKRCSASKESQGHEEGGAKELHEFT